MTLPDLDFLSSTNISYLRKKKDNNDYFHHHFSFTTTTIPLLFSFMALNHSGRASQPLKRIYPQKSKDFSHAFIKVWEE